MSEHEDCSSQDFPLETSTDVTNFSSTTAFILRVSSLGYFHFSEHGTDRDEMDSMRSSKGSCILSDSDEHMTLDKE